MGKNQVYAVNENTDPVTSSYGTKVATEEDDKNNQNNLTLTIDENKQNYETNSSNNPDSDPPDIGDDGVPDLGSAADRLLYYTSPAPTDGVEEMDRLRTAVKNNDLESAKKAIEAGASVNIPEYVPEYNGFLPLVGLICYYPHLHGDGELVRLMIENHACVDGRGSKGDTALIFCCYWKNISLSRYLLDKKADLNLTGENNYNAMVFASKTPSYVKGTIELACLQSAQLIRLLISYKASCQQDRHSVLEAVDTDNICGVVALIEAGYVVAKHPTLLHEVVQKEEMKMNTMIEMCKLLINALADVTSIDGADQTAMDYVDKMHGEDSELALILTENFDQFCSWQSPRTHVNLGRRLSSRRLQKYTNSEEVAPIGIDKADLPKSGVKPEGGQDSPRSSEDSDDRRAREKEINQLERRSIFKIFAQSIEAPCRKLNADSHFQILMLVFLLIALFIPDIWILTDSDPSKLDSILIVVICAFAFEFGVQFFGLRYYKGTFFFYMDILGTFSVLLDFKFFNDAIKTEDTSGSGGNRSMMVMRTARLAKLGARAGRFSKLVKLLRFLPGMRDDPGERQNTAKIISGQVNSAVSMRVAMLIILLVLVIPIGYMFTMMEMEQDQSLNSWGKTLLWMYSYHGGEALDPFIEEFYRFYEDSEIPFKPYVVMVEELTENGFIEILRREHAEYTPPKSEENSVTRTSGPFDYSHDLRILTKWNFESPKKLDSAVNIATITFVIFALLGFSLLLSNVVTAMVLRPLENLLYQVRSTASTIFKSVTDMSTSLKDSHQEATNNDEGFEDEADAKDALNAETVILERVVEKLAIISEIMMKKSTIDAETMELVRTTVADGDKEEDKESDFSDDDSPHIEKAEQERMKLVSSGINLSNVLSWDFNTHDFDWHQLTSVCMWFWHGRPDTLEWIDNTLQIEYGQLYKFVETVSAGYVKANPYHSWFHACDVTHCVYLSMQECCGSTYFNVTEKFSLILSALCHDLAHPGFNNPFLVETSHELAVRYNDKSPLENMHCALLFQLAMQNPETAILHNLPKPVYSELRKVCVEAIFHTDMAHHFAMVKEMQMMYEVNSGIMNKGHSMEAWSEDQWTIPSGLADVYRQNDNRKLLRNVLLHIADISNSCKPFIICRQWAHRVLDEFFLQGDTEKELGIPVQMLNDRNKVNRPFSQLGFIEFIVAPLVFSVARVLSPIAASAEQLVSNARQWQAEWVENTDPSAKEEAAVSDRMAALELKYQEACLNLGSKK